MVAAVVAVLCLLGGLVFFAALMVMRDDRPKSSKTRLSAGGGIRWPTVAASGQSTATTGPDPPRRRAGRCFATCRSGPYI